MHLLHISRKFYQLFFACVKMQSNGILFQHSKHNWKRLHCWTKIFLKRYACICILLYNVHTQQTKYMQKQSTMHSGNTKNTTITWHNWNSLHWWTKLFHRDTHAYTTVHYTTVQVYNVQCKISMYKFNRYPPHMTPPWMATQHNQAPQHHHATRPNISPSPNSIHYPPRLLPNMDYHPLGRATHIPWTQVDKNDILKALHRHPLMDAFLRPFFQGLGTKNIYG